MRIVITTVVGLTLGFLIGISFPTVSITKLHFPSSFISYIEDKNSGISSQALLNHAWTSSQKNNSMLNSTGTAKTKLCNSNCLNNNYKACAGMCMLDLGQQIHAYMIKAGSDSDTFVVVELIDLYAKCECCEDSLKAFSLMSDHDVVAWNAVISDYSHNGNDEEALSLFAKMRKDGLQYNRTTLTAVLKSVANVMALAACKQTHNLATKAGLFFYLHVANGLVDAYGKCSSLEDASGLVDAYKLRNGRVHHEDVIFKIEEKLSFLINAKNVQSKHCKGDNFFFSIIKMKKESDGDHRSVIFKWLRRENGWYKLIIDDCSKGNPVL